MNKTTAPRTDSQLVQAFRQGMQLRREMIAEGATRAQADKALENILRANWPVPPIEEWPEKYRQPRCGQCDGYGLLIRTVTNRLGCVVTEGTPCTCWAGDRYRKPTPPPAADFTQAGKTPPKPKPGWMTKW